MLDFNKVPRYEAQPFHFKQETLRTNLAESDDDIAVFKAAISGSDDYLNVLFEAGENIRSLVRKRSDFIDLVLHYAWQSLDWDDDISLIAVGGYGRQELHPFSDIDIMILTKDEVDKKYDQQLQSFVTFLWDIGLAVGSSVRSLSECIRIAREDITVTTNLLESRHLCGNHELFLSLRELTGPDHMWPAKEFFAAKSEEQSKRHNKHNNTECDLEPNIKNSPGGMRDSQMIGWVAKRFFNVNSLTKLIGKDFFTENEYSLYRHAEEVLWTVRYGVHMITGRAEERLLFEHQRELAKMFGYKDTAAELAVEQFMHKYYRAVISLRELNEVLLQYLYEKINTSAEENRIAPINERFQLRDNRIEVSHPDVFDEHPSALLEIFVLMGNNPQILGVRASTIRLIRAKRYLIDDEFRKQPENRAMFTTLFSINYGLVSELKRMKHYGVLGRYLPAFDQIIGQMQHDLFHRYTVDGHTLRVIENMRRFTLPEESQQFPVAAHIIRHLPKVQLLYIAGLFHDIGKGRGGDHSELGAVDAEEFCLNHGYSKKDTALVRWLVEKHLMMSYVSQKKDISDPDIVREFAMEVGDQLRLDYLYTLTVADMCGTNPEIWNSWRASLMRQLYFSTKRALRRGLENPANKDERIEETKALALAKLKDKNIDQDAALKLWQDMGEEYFIRESHRDIAAYTEAQLNHDGAGPLIVISKATSSYFETATQIFIFAPDTPHVFAAATTALTNLNLNIQDAKIYRSNSGYTLDTFFVLDENFSPLSEDPQLYARIHKSLIDELEQTGLYSDIVARRTPRQLKQFSTPTQTSISNDIVTGYTALEVISPDRPGLLATVAEVFLEENISVFNARISTLGERVEDVFFITDLNGNPLSDAQACENLQAKICRRLDRQVKQDLSA